MFFNIKQFSGNGNGGGLQSCYETLSNLLLEEIRESDIIGALELNKLVVLLPYADAKAGIYVQSPFEDVLKYFRPGTFETRQAFQPKGLVSWQQEIGVDPDRTQDVQVFLTPGQNTLAPGFYMMSFDIAKSPPAKAYPPKNLIVISDIQLILKQSATEALVWATDLRTNQPAVGAPSTIYDTGGSVIDAGQTDENGILRASFRGLVDTNENVSYFWRYEKGLRLAGLTVANLHEASEKRLPLSLLSCSEDESF